MKTIGIRRLAQLIGCRERTLNWMILRGEMPPHLPPDHLRLASPSLKSSTRDKLLVLQWDRAVIDAFLTEKKPVDVKALAARLGCSRSKIYRMIQMGDLPAPIGRRNFVWSWWALHDWLIANTPVNRRLFFARQPWGPSCV